ncbi:Piwi domain-containing protein [Fomes fomentarius]|nr:Piwi domain-containing protein [Fomes fomentarius]
MPPKDVHTILQVGGSEDSCAPYHSFGDITHGVATQCLQSAKCVRANEQYSRTIIVKMGGINTIPNARSVPVLTDPHNPTVVMSADVIHPAPGADGRPSFTALVGNVDSDAAKYLAECRDMALKILGIYRAYQTKADRKSPDPKRIIFYQDGVSEGQFQHVLDFAMDILRRTRPFSRPSDIVQNPAKTIVSLRSTGAYCILYDASSVRGEPH